MSTASAGSSGRFPAAFGGAKRSRRAYLRRLVGAGFPTASRAAARGLAGREERTLSRKGLQWSTTSIDPSSAFPGGVYLNLRKHSPHSYGGAKSPFPVIA